MTESLAIAKQFLIHKIHDTKHELQAQWEVMILWFASCFALIYMRTAIQIVS